jgi:hypothetical protein
MKLVQHGNSLQMERRNEAVWIPKSVAVWNPADNDVDGTMDVPRWFAEKEGLV